MKTDAPTIAQQIAALDTATTDEMIEQYQRLLKKAPRTRNRPWLLKRLAWAIQAEAFGGLSANAQKRLDELIGQIGPLTDPARTVTTTLPHQRRPNAPAVGTTLVRQWHDQEVRVRVLAEGFEWNDVVYGSLSAVAKAVTGQHWSGTLFFQLRPRKTAS